MILAAVFIDARVPDLQRLIAGVLPNQPVFVLDPAQDGVQQIAGILADCRFRGLAAPLGGAWGLDARGHRLASGPTA
jgi:hypothetical protein